MTDRITCTKCGSTLAEGTITPAEAAEWLTSHHCGEPTADVSEEAARARTKLIQRIINHSMVERKWSPQEGGVANVLLTLDELELGPVQVQALKAWKAEASDVLMHWETAFQALPRSVREASGALGRRKSDVVFDYIRSQEGA